MSTAFMIVQRRRMTSLKTWVDPRVAFKSVEYALTLCADRQTWLLGENHGQKINEYPNLGRQPPPRRVDSADRKRRRFIVAEYNVHGMGRDFGREKPSGRVR